MHPEIKSPPVRCRQKKFVARARRASRRTHTYCMPITRLQIGSTFGRVEIASAINLFGPPRGGKSAALSVWSGLVVLGPVVSGCSFG